MQSPGQLGSQSHPDNGVQYIAFNQLGDMFVIVVNDEVTVYCCDPFNVVFEITQEDFRKAKPKDGFWSIYRAEMCDDEMLLAIIPAACTTYPRSADNRVWFWHAKTNQLGNTFLSDCAILSVKLRKGLFVTSTENEIFVGTYPGKEKIAEIPTSNGMGVLALSPTSALLNVFAAFPYVENDQGGLHLIEVSVQNLKIKEHRKVRAHHNPLACIVFNPSGTLMATASNRGCSISLRRTSTLDEICRFRRGVDPAHMYCISFNADSSLMSAISDNGTLHVYRIDSIDEESTRRNRSSSQTFQPSGSPKSSGSVGSFSQYIAESIAQMKSTASSQPSTEHSNNWIRAVVKFDANCRLYSQCAHYKNFVFVLTVECDLHQLVYSPVDMTLKRIMHEKVTDPFNDTGL